MADESPTLTLRRVSPAWAWVRENFSLPALLTIAGVFIAAGAGYLDGRSDLKALRRADPTRRLEAIERSLQELREGNAADHQQLADLAGEVAEQRSHWERVERVAEAPIRFPYRRPSVRPVKGSPLPGPQN